jgi:hypothetical protein
MVWVLLSGDLLVRALQTNEDPESFSSTIIGRKELSGFSFKGVGCSKPRIGD